MAELAQTQGLRYKSVLKPLLPFLLLYFYKTGTEPPPGVESP